MRKIPGGWQASGPAGTLPKRASLAHAMTMVERPAARPRGDPPDLAVLLRQRDSLREVIESISGELDLRQLLTRIVRHACELLDAHFGSIGLYDEERDLIRTEAVVSMPERELGAEMPPGVGLAGQVLLTRKPIVIDRYDTLPAVTLPELSDHAVVGVPIFWHDRLIGFFGIGAEPPRRFGENDVEMLSLFARHAAIAIENARLFERARRLAVLEERQRLARDLHDSITQMLFSASLMAQSIGAAWKRDAAEGEKIAGRVVALTQAALAEMRTLLHELRPFDASPEGSRAATAPSALDRLKADGLAQAIRQDATAMGPEEVALVLDLGSYSPQALEIEEALYRVFQEALHNVLRHAGAERVLVHLSSDPKGALLQVADDGAGFDPTASASDSSEIVGLGLRSMRSRIESLGGAFRLLSAPGEGAIVEARIPTRNA